MFTFVHAADIHLDSALRGLDRYDGAPVEQLRGATRKAFANLVQFCREERVAFLLLAGDLYDGDWRDYNTGLFFTQQMSLLRDANIPALLVRGNHDAASHITRALRLPANVHDFTTRKPETFRLESLNVAVHGQGFSTREVRDDLSAEYPAAELGALNIGLLHTSAEGREGHDAYAPCSTARLVDHGYDYWALGHIHKREVLHSSPHILFPGNLQGRHAKETGPKGATVVTVDDGRIVTVEHRTFDTVRWVSCEVSLENAGNADDAVDLARIALSRALDAADGRSLAARVRLTGRSKAHGELIAHREKWVNEIRAAATDAGSDSIWVEKVLIETAAAADIAALRERDDPLGELLREIDRLRTDDAGLVPLLEELRQLRDKLPADILETGDLPPLDEVGTLRRALDDVEQILLPRVLSSEGP